MSLSMFLSTPAATAAKLGAKLDAGRSGLWHWSLRYKVFMLNREKAKFTSQQDMGRNTIVYVP